MLFGGNSFFLFVKCNLNLVIFQNMHKMEDGIAKIASGNCVSNIYFIYVLLCLSALHTQKYPAYFKAHILPN